MIPPSTTKSLLIVVVPRSLPMLIVVALVNAFTLAEVLAILNVLADTVMFPPSILTLPSTSKLLLTLVVPVAAPISILVAAPAKFTRVAVPLTILATDDSVEIVPPRTAIFPTSVPSPTEETLNLSAAKLPSSISLTTKSKSSVADVTSTDTVSTLIAILFTLFADSAINLIPVPMPLAGVPDVVCLTFNG